MFPPLLSDAFDPTYVSTFAFTPGVTPLSSLTSITSLLLLYFLSIWALKDFIHHRTKPFTLTTVSATYNASLSLLSLYLLYHHLSVISTLLSTHTFWSILCDEAGEHTTGPKTFSLYLIYLTKFFELSDTLLLCLRGKPTPFIHLYHHPVTVAFAYLHLTAQTCLGWTMPILNLTVHVFLYLYFALHDLGLTVWWKRHLTLMQVTQFYLTLIPTAVTLIPKLIHAVSPTLPLAYACHARWPSVYLGLPLLLSYLLLFQRLYHGKYRTTSPTPTLKAA